MKKLFFFLTLLSFSVVLNAQVINLSVSPNSSCPGAPVVLSVIDTEGQLVSTQMGYTFTWSNGQTNVPSITVYPMSTTTYSVEVKFWSSGNVVWQDVLTRTAVVTSGPLVNFSVSPNAGCAGDSFKFELRDSNGNLLPNGGGWSYSLSTGQQNMNSVTMTLNQTTTVTATVTSPEGCTQTLTRTAVVNPKPTISVEKVVSTNEAVLLANTNDLNDAWFTWNTGDMGQYTKVTQTGVYTVTVTNKYGCSAVASISVNDFHYYVPDTVTMYVDTCMSGSGGPKPVANFTVSNNEGCGPLTVQFWDLSSNNPTSWQWSFPGGELAPGSTVNSQNPVVIYNHAGYFPVSLVASNASGSSDFFSISNVIHVTGQAPQILSVSADPPAIWPGEWTELSLSVSGSGHYAFEWSHAGTLNNANYQNPIAAPTVTTPYTVKVTDIVTGCMSLGYVTVTVIGTVANDEVEGSDDFEIIDPIDGTEIQIKGTPGFRVALFDVASKEIRSQYCDVEESTFSKDGLAAGIYYLQIVQKNKLYVKPIVVVN